MKVLIVGAAGYVGSIVRPALEQQHECSYFDRETITGVGDRQYLGDVNDDNLVKRATYEVQGIIYLALGVRPGSKKDVQDIDQAFAVNVTGYYRFLKSGLAAGASHIIYASSLSVYDRPTRRRGLDERTPPDEFEPYGLSKRMGECLGEAAAHRYPETTIMALRLSFPRNQSDWDTFKQRADFKTFYALGPKDVQRLFLAAMAFKMLGFYAINATGDQRGEHFPNSEASKLLGWYPRGE